MLKEHTIASLSKPASTQSGFSISVVVATRDRPLDLRSCLQSLAAQDYAQSIEIIVVDNNPVSGLTPPVLAEFPDVILINERREGLAYARNKGFAASRGDVVIATDDDVTMPSDWLKKLTSPFIQPDVMVVTGNVLPVELETVSQRLFEAYGGLGSGHTRRVVDKNWFDSFLTAVPVWRLGATANAAFRAAVFSHPQIGLMDEALGPGTPTGVGEDEYLFYKVLKAGYTLVYEPEAFVWHKHRREMPALRQQIYGYSKGQVAYLLTTIIRDKDIRSLTSLFAGLPARHIRSMIRRLTGMSEYPFSLILLEVAGNLAGTWSLWRSRRRVRNEGLSDRYIPPCERSELSLKNAK